MCLAIPAKIVEVLPGAENVGVVDITGVRRKVDLSLLRDEGVGTGDWVLIHVGFALSKINEADAVEQLRVLSILGEDEAAMEEARGYGFDESGAPDEIR